MSEADRIVAQREREAAEAKVAEEEARRSAVRRQRGQAWQDVQHAVAPALVSLERNGWQSARTINLERKTLFGYKSYSKAAYEICSYRQPWKDTQISTTVYLVSDGRLAMTTARGGPALIEKQILDSVVSGTGYWGALPLDEVLGGLQSIIADNQKSP